MSEEKICPECSELLALNKFKSSKRKDKIYYSKVCQRCYNIRLRNYRNEYYKKRRSETPGYDKEYKEKYRTSDKGKSKIKEYSIEHSIENSVRGKVWYKNNKDKNRIRVKNWIKENPDAYKKLYTKANQKRQSDPLLNFSMRIRGAVQKSFRKTFLIKREKTFSMLGYSNVNLHSHLEKYLDKPCEICSSIIIELNNSNIDHIIPVCVAKTKEDIVKLNQLINLRLICITCNANKISSDLKIKEEYNGRLDTSSS